MQLLPSGLVVPPVWALLVLGVGSAAVFVALDALDPPTTGAHVLAFTPWMVAGGVFHVLYQVRAVPGAAAPLFAAPAVYVTTFVLLGAVWAASGYGRGTGGDTGTRSDREAETDPGSAVDTADSPTDALSLTDAGPVARDVGLVGGGVALVLATLAYRQALAMAASVRPLLWPAVGFVLTLVVFAPLYYLLAAWKPTAVRTVGTAGAVAVFAHLLDGVSTAIGVDLLGTAERTPLPRYVMDFAGTLPTAPAIGRGWLFVLVKFVVVGFIVILLADYVEAEPDEGYLLLAFVTALGLGPAANNLFLFIMAGSVPA